MERAIKAWKAAGIPTFEMSEEDYERAVAISNFLFRFSRPGCVLQPKSAQQVQTIIKEAKSKNIKVTIRCQGHSYEGASTADDGILLDLRLMKNVNLDMKKRIVVMDGGCSWGNVYKTLINGRHNGFVINGGRCPFVGVGGFILGGGLGPFSRTIGMGSDTLTEAEIVTAEGKLIKVKETDSPTSNEGKLFWALKGAGGGNFGVVTKMTLRVHQLWHPEGIVVAGRYQWFPEGGLDDAVGEVMDKFYTTDWPLRLTIDTTWMCDLRTRNGDGIRFLTYFDGDKPEFEQIIDKYIKQPDLAKQLKRRSMPEKSTRFLAETLALQWSEESKRAFPSRTDNKYTIYSSFVFGNKDAKIISQVTSVLREEMKAFRSLFAGEQVEFLATFIHIGGKSTEPKPNASAFFWRKAAYHMYVTVEWEDKWMESSMRGFLGKVKGRLRPLSLKGTAAFINFPDGSFPQEQHEKAYFGDNREELRRVKQIWDPQNFFGWLHGVRLPTDANGRPWREADPRPEEDGKDDEKLTDVVAADQWETLSMRNFKLLVEELDDWF